MSLVGAGQGRIGIKEKYGDVIEMLRPHLAAGIEIAPLRDAYPAGDEFILVYDVLGRVDPTRRHAAARRRRGAQRGDGHEPGPADRQPVTEKYLTVAGAVAEPVTLRVPVGVTLAAVRRRGRRARPSPTPITWSAA